MVHVVYKRNFYSFFVIVALFIRNSGKLWNYLKRHICWLGFGNCFFVILQFVFFFFLSFYYFCSWSKVIQSTLLMMWQQNSNLFYRAHKLLHVVLFFLLLWFNCFEVVCAFRLVRLGLVYVFSIPLSRHDLAKSFDIYS